MFEETENGEGTVTEILPRSSELIRPPIANVNVVVLVFSVTEPVLNLQLLDKFLVHIENTGIEVVLCFTKSDLLSTHNDAAAPKEMTVAELERITQLYEGSAIPWSKRVLVRESVWNPFCIIWKARSAFSLGNPV